MSISPFDAIAPRYAELWSGSESGRSQREQVWSELDLVFHQGQTILDVGCGIGDDGLHLMERGVRVVGIDSSARMVEICRARGVEAHCGSIEYPEPLFHAFDGVLSNFGAFNCVAEPRRAIENLARVLRPRSYFVLCVLSRFCWSESVRAAAKLDWATAIRRWSGRATWRGLQVFYRSSREWSRLCAPEFRLVCRKSIGCGDHQLFIFERMP